MKAQKTMAGRLLAPVDPAELTKRANKVVVIGDIHGNNGAILKAAKDNPGSTLIQLGDFGIGFQIHEEEELYQLDRLNKVLTQKDCMLWVMRGNHDDPAYWKEKNPMMSNIKMIPDHTTRVIGGKSIHMIGGGVSIDRRLRTEGVSYWAGEVMTLPIKSEPLEVDVLITHTGPGNKYISDKLYDLGDWLKKDDKLQADLWEEAAMVEDLRERITAPLHVCGHFHKSATVKTKVDTIKFLNINETLTL